MQSYEYSSAEAQRIRYLLNIRVAIPIAITVTFFLLYFYFTNPKESFSVTLYLGLTLLVLSICGFIIFNLILIILFSIKITIDTDRLTIQQVGYGNTIIHRDEIKQIVETEMSGIHIKTTSKSVFIPIELTGYDQIKTSLAAWFPLKSKSNRERYLIYLLFGSVPLVIIMMPIESTRIYSLVLSIVMALMSFMTGLIMTVIRIIKRNSR